MLIISNFINRTTDTFHQIRRAVLSPGAAKAASIALAGIAAYSLYSLSQNLDEPLMRQCTKLAVVAASSAVAALIHYQSQPSLFEEGLRNWCDEKRNTDEYDNRIRAAQEIRECRTTNATRLDLSGKGLTSLPPAIGSLTNLQALNLNDNRLASHPPEIGSLTNLQELYLEGNQFASLPHAISSLRNLHWLLLNRNQLTALPLALGLILTNLEGLELADNQLTSIPRTIGTLTNLENLFLQRNRLESLPPAIGSLTNLQGLMLSDNPLTSLPSELLNLPHNCHIHLINSGLSEAVLDRLRGIMQNPDYRGPRVHYSMQAPHIVAVTLSDLISDLYQKLNRSSPAFSNLAAADAANNYLSMWLNRLSWTATFKRGGETQQQFAAKIASFLEEAEANPDFRSLFMNVLEDASTTCGDRVALSILHIGIQHRLATFDTTRARDLARFLIHGPMALGLLEEYARNIIPTFPLVDQIEVYLGLPIMLQERLDLPIDISEMLFYRCSNLNDEHLANAEQYVLAQINNRHACIEFLINQPKWLAALQQHFPQEFDTIRDAYESQIADASSVTEGTSIRTALDTQLKELTNRLF